MQRRPLDRMILAFTAACFMMCSEAPEESNPFLGHLPGAGDTETWNPSETPQYVKGDDLFLLINGGAEIYHEYGFTQAAVQSYEDDDGRALNLEVYEMVAPASAYGIFTFKRGKNCEVVDIGDESCLQDYYLNVWKGAFLITVVGFDTESETRQGLIALARATSQTIDITGSKPQLMEILPEGVDQTSVTVFMKGNLALFNSYDFGKGNVFGVQEGVSFKKAEHSVFMFRYTSSEEASHWFEAACEHFSQEEKFQEVLVQDGKLTARDSEARSIVAAFRDNIIVLVMSNGFEGAVSTLENILKTIGSSEA